VGRSSLKKEDEDILIHCCGFCWPYFEVVSIRLGPSLSAILGRPLRCTQKSKHYSKNIPELPGGPLKHVGDRRSVVQEQIFGTLTTANPEGAFNMLLHSCIILTRPKKKKRRETKTHSFMNRVLLVNTYTRNFLTLLGTDTLTEIHFRAFTRTEASFRCVKRSHI